MIDNAAHGRSRSRLRAVMMFPLVRLLVAGVLVVLAFLAAQKLVSLLPLVEWARAVALAVVGVVAVVTVYFAYVRFYERRGLSEFSRPGALKELGVGLAIGAALFTGTIGVLAALGVYRVTGYGSAENLVELLLIGGVLAGVFEETLFRGVVFRILEEWLGTWIALIISAVLFGLIHLLNPNATLFGALSIILEAGVLLAAAYVVTRRLWLVIGLHAAWNFTQGGIFGVQVSGMPAKGLLRGTLSGPTWLSGGDFGAEASIVAVILCVSVAIAFLVRAIRTNRIVPAPFLRARASAPA